MSHTTTQIIAKEGWYQLIFFGFFALFFFFLGWSFFCFFSLLLFGVVAMSYYNPERLPPESGETALLSPIDGVVKEIRTEEGSCVVRINSPLCFVGILRMPIQGEITVAAVREGLRLCGGKRVLRDTLNALGGMEIKTSYGTISLLFRPKFFLSNLFFYPKPPLFVAQSRRIGFMRHGELEVVLPASVHLSIQEGDRIRGGESLLGSFPS